MRRLFIITLCLLSLPTLADMISAPMSPDRWSREPTPLNYAGREAFLLAGGAYELKDVQMKNGRISVDIFTPGQRGFVGIVFRMNGANGELFYLRPHKTRLPDTIQYTPIFNGMSAWQLYHDERYLATAEVPQDRWVNYTLEFIDHRLKIFVDNDPSPVLDTQLKHEASAGQIGLWGNGAGFFSNVKYESLPEAKAKVPYQQQEMASGVIKNWQLSQRLSANQQSQETIPSGLTFTAVEVEDQGLVNVSRYHPRGPGKALVYAKTSLQSKQAKRVKVWVGYSDEATIFLNGEPIYHGNSTFNWRAPFALGLLDDDHDAVYLDLQPGNNELILAVGETFGGWGFMARIDE